MTEIYHSRTGWINDQVQRLTGQSLRGLPVIFDDTSNFMSIDRDHIVDLEGKLFLIRRNEREGRFGLDDQPKFWVKRTMALDSGKTLILKLVFREEFTVRIGTIRIKCSRSGEKEGKVLQLVQGDPRFMQGHTAKDARGNLVRVIDFIRGVDLLDYLGEITLPHDQYFHARFPDILAQTVDCLRAIALLHEEGLCHGDIRNDHIFVERETGRFRWIDFDLTQDFSDYDIWSAGNILHCIAGKGFITFRGIIPEHPELSGRLMGSDASVIFPHRVMNLKMVYPYVPEKLNSVLMRFSAGTRVYYDRIDQIVDDLGDVMASQGWPAGSPADAGVSSVDG